MPELGSLGSVRGAFSNERPYRVHSHCSPSFTPLCLRPCYDSSPLKSRHVRPIRTGSCSAARVSRHQRGRWRRADRRSWGISSSQGFSRSLTPGRAGRLFSEASALVGEDRGQRRKPNFIWVSVCSSTGQLGIEAARCDDFSALITRSAARRRCRAERLSVVHYGRSMRHLSPDVLDIWRQSRAPSALPKAAS